MPDQPIMRVGRTLSQTPGPCTIYRVTGDGTDECVGLVTTTEIAEAIGATVNARGIPLPASNDPGHRLLEEALFLRVNGERPPGAPRDNPKAETWAEWDRRCEEFLRSLPVRRIDGDVAATRGSESAS